MADSIPVSVRQFRHDDTSYTWVSLPEENIEAYPLLDIPDLGQKAGLIVYVERKRKTYEVYVDADTMRSVLAHLDSLQSEEAVRDTSATRIQKFSVTCTVDGCASCGG